MVWIYKNLKGDVNHNSNIIEKLLYGMYTIETYSTNQNWVSDLNSNSQLPRPGDRRNFDNQQNLSKML